MDEVILKYLQKDMSIEDQHRLTKWLEEDEVNGRILNKIETLWRYSPGAAQLAQEEVWARLMDRVENEEVPAAVQRTGFWRYALRVAAILVLGVGLSFVIVEFQGQQAPATVQTVRYLEKVSLNGQKISIRLPDGTRVKLNAGSRLIAPETFAADRREVELEGEAFFEVQRDEARPFVVKSGGVNVRVLGTSFNVRAYPDEAAIKVAVNTGKVAVQEAAGKASVTLLPDQMAVYQPKSGLRFQEGFNRLAEFGWKDKTLYFEKASFSEVIETLRKWYGVEFTVNRVVDDKKDFTATYTNKSLETVLEGLAFVYGFEYKIKEDMVTIN